MRERIAEQINSDDQRDIKMNQINFFFLFLRLLKNHLVILFLALLSFDSWGQHDFIQDFNKKRDQISNDSLFLLLDNEIDRRIARNEKPEKILSLLDLKAEIADSLNDNFQEYYAYEAMRNYRLTYTAKDYFFLLKKIAQLESNAGLTDDAVKTYFEAADLADSLKNDTLLALIYKGIGTEYKKQDNADLSLKYLKISLNLFEELHDTIEIIGIYMTQGNAYKLKKDENSSYLDTAFNYYQKSLKLSLDLNYTRGIAGNYNNIGNVYKHQEKYDQALESFFMALEINIETNNQQWISYNYHNIGSLYQQKNNHKAAITYLSKSLHIKEKLNNIQGIQEASELLADSYGQLGNFKIAYEYGKRARELKNDIEAADRQKLAQELEARYQNQKKEAEINQLMAEQSLQQLVIEEKQKDLDHQAALRASEKYLIYALAFILLILVVTVIVFWRNSQQRKKYTETLTVKNKEIEEVSIQIEQARANLELKNREVTDSINYAKRIQAAILPSQATLDSYLASSFVLYHPKDIVAGDFYWTERLDNLTLFAVADCTGHGVPGAMVSVICHNALNTVVKQMGISEPGKILDETTRIVLEQFEKSKDEVRDGMDIALCAYDETSRKLTYAGANMPLWLVRNGEPIKFKATKQPVGNYSNRVPFETLVIPILKHDMIYLSSDGFVDQFGGEKGKKFLNIRFKKLLTQLSLQSMKDQPKMMDEAFYNWKGSHDQVDDICVLGIRVDH